jgi:hypothetical protein
MRSDNSVPVDAPCDGPRCRPEKVRDVGSSLPKRGNLGDDRPGVGRAPQTVDDPFIGQSGSTTSRTNSSTCSTPIDVHHDVVQA